MGGVAVFVRATATLIESGERQSNAIAKRPKRAIQQTTASNAKARPTSGQARSIAVNMTPSLVYRSPWGCFYFAVIDERR